MGASSVCMSAAAKDPLVTAVVADSAFSSLERLCRDLVSKVAGGATAYAVAGLAIKQVGAAVRWHAGFEIADCDAASLMPSCVAPVMLVHGDADVSEPHLFSVLPFASDLLRARAQDFITPDHSSRLRDACTSALESRLVLHAGGAHNSRRAPDVIIEVASFLWKYLAPAGTPQAMRDTPPPALAETLRGLAKKNRLLAPPWQGAVGGQFVSGMSRDRQKGVQNAVGKMFGK